MYYILGISHLTLDECEEVMRDVTKRREDLGNSKAAISREVNHLDTIAFQVSSRKKEIIDHNEHVEKVLYNKIKALLNDGKRWEEIFIFLNEGKEPSKEHPTWNQLKTWYDRRKTKI